MTNRKAIASFPFKGDVKNSDGSINSVKFNARVIQPTGSNALYRGVSGDNQSKVIEQGKQSSSAYDRRLIDPVYNQLELVYLEEISNVLRECIDSMVVNIEGFGYMFRPRKMTESDKKKYQNDVENELSILSYFFDKVSPSCSFIETRKKMRSDLELTGNGYFEIVQDSSGEILEINHVPSYQIRLSKLDNNMTQYEYKIVRPDNGFEIESIKRYKKFRRYAQVDSNGKPVVWFKEYLDPRNISSKDGKSKPRLGLKSRATSILHFKIYSPRSVYGIPRHISRYVSAKGSRRSEEVNYFTLSNNHMPSMFILLENGALTDASINRLQEYIEGQVSGDPNHSKFIILEAEADMNEILPGSPGAPKMTLKSAVESQHSDQMYQKYDKNNQDKIRQAFRLPPIFVGRSDDYTRSTASESRKLADEQIFHPERTIVDDAINRLLVNSVGIRFFHFRSKTPNITDNSELATAMGIAEKSGGMTPRRADVLMTDIFDGELGPMPEGVDLDVPYSIQFAQAQNAQRPPDGDEVEPIIENEEVEK